MTSANHARLRQAMTVIPVLALLLGLFTVTAEQSDAAPKYDRNAAASWALKHAKDDQRVDGLCTWFATQAVWAGGLSNAPKFVYVDQFVDYYVSTLRVAWVPLDLRANKVPAAEKGDIIVYDWEGDNHYDHLAVVTNIASGQYPEVSEWGTVNIEGWKQQAFGANSSYDKRGWTYSVNDHKFLQNSTKFPAVKAYLMHFTGYIPPSF